MRLIDADALLKQLAKVARRADEDAKYAGDRGSELTWDMAMKYIKNAPTIEPTPKRGKWYFRDTTRYSFLLPYVCTACGREADDIYDFCPNCGADMRG